MINDKCFYEIDKEEEKKVKGTLLTYLFKANTLIVIVLKKKNYLFLYIL